jgi:alkaline phosphatase D
MLKTLKRRALAPMLALPWAASLAQARGQPPLTRIAFGSCADQTRPQPIWGAILAYRPELFLFMGDNVYGDADGADIAPLRRAYDAARQIPGYVRLRETVPHLAIWDDHDFGKNDGGADYPLKAAAKDEFLRFWDLPADDIRRSREGLYHAEIVGPPGARVQVILLDLRWFRSPLKRTDQPGAPGKERYLPDADPAKTMLGPAQWAWLAEELKKPAEIRLVVSSIQALAGAHGWERWGNLPLERQKLFDTIAASSARGVVLLSGDRHVGALYRETPPGLYPLHEVTSSGINMVFRAANEPGPNRLGDLYAAANFGTVDIDWQRRHLTLAVRGESGTPSRSLLVDFATIGLS